LGADTGISGGDGRPARGRLHFDSDSRARPIAAQMHRGLIARAGAVALPSLSPAPKLNRYVRRESSKVMPVDRNAPLFEESTSTGYRR
jgi:hypothetical protein